MIDICGVMSAYGLHEFHDGIYVVNEGASINHKLVM